MGRRKEGGKGKGEKGGGNGEGGRGGEGGKKRGKEGEGEKTVLLVRTFLEGECGS